MALSFPLSLANFYDKLSIVECGIHLPELLNFTRSRDGSTFVDSMGERLWMGSITLHRRSHADVGAAEAILSLVRSGQGAFRFCDPRYLRPAADQAEVVAGSSVTISSVHGNRRDLTLAGLPTNYTLSPGDRLSFGYTVSGEARYAYHQITVGGSTGAGTTRVVQVDPPIRDGFAVGEPVTLIRPWMMAIYLPDSYQPSSGRQMMSDGLSFAVQQVLAA